MNQLMENPGAAISIFGWILICFVEIALPLFVVALILYLWRLYKKQTDWKDMLCTKEKVVNILILIVFPPMAAYEYGLRKALMTLLMQFIGYSATWLLCYLIHVLLVNNNININENINEFVFILALYVLSWGTGILYAINQKKKSTKL